MLLDAGPFLAPLARRLAAGEHRDLLSPFRLVDPSCAPVLASPAVDDPVVASRRRSLAACLARTNRDLGHPRADELAERLADPATLVVVTGQQPGLFGGPLYALSKLLAAVRWAESLAEDSGRRALPLFWMATEDHDFAEVSHCWLPLGEGGALERLELPDDGLDLVPVGRRALGPGVEALIARLRAASTGERQRAWIERLARIYRPERTFGEAFGRLMIELLGPRCPLLIDALDPAFKEVQRDLLRELVERREEVASALVERDAEIERRGLPHQVSPQPDCAPLFLLSEISENRVPGDPASGDRARGDLPPAARRRLQWQAVGGVYGVNHTGG